MASGVTSKMFLSSSFILEFSSCRNSDLLLFSQKYVKYERIMVMRANCGEIRPIKA